MKNLQNFVNRNKEEKKMSNKKQNWNRYCKDRIELV